MTANWLPGAALALGTLAGADTKVYRYEDAHGIAVFSDRPGIGRQEVALPVANAYTPVGSTEPASAPLPAEAEAKAIYRSLVITAPGDGETIRRNGGNVRVTGRVEPGVREGHRAVLLVDGEPPQDRAGSPANTQGKIEFALEGVARGPHTLRIAIMDRDNSILAQSAPVSFHLLRVATGQRR